MQIIKFTALWCTSCLLMKGRWKTFFQDVKTVAIIDFDYDDSEQEVKAYQIGNILPVMIICDEHNHEIMRIVGEKSLKELHQLLDEVIK